MKKFPLLLTLLFVSIASSVSAQDCQVKTTALVNGKVLTLDADFSEANSILIQDTKIIGVSSNQIAADACTEVIDLYGHTVIPGLIDSHTHFIRQANMPGNDTRAAEEARTIKQFQDIIRSRTQTVPPEQFISVMGGVVPAQIIPEGRLPNLNELDEAAPDHPVYIQIGFSGPGMTNSKGKNLFENIGVKVTDEGFISQGAEANKAFGLIKGRQTSVDHVTSIKALMKYSNRLGLTTVHDQGGVVFPGGGFFDIDNDYDAVVKLWRQGETSVRIRTHHGASDSDPAAGEVEARINNAWPHIGDDMLRMTAMGEHIVTFPRDGKISPAYPAKVLAIAKKGWPHEQHSVSEVENAQHFAAMKSAHERYPINQLRWSLAHVFELGHPNSSIKLEELASMGMGLKLQTQGYVAPTDRFPLGRTLQGDNSGPLFRTLYDSGLPLGAGTDGPLVIPMNPWHSIYYMVTGKDVKGDLVNPGQTLSRLEALRLYTMGSAWFSFDEKQLGSLEVGKLADIVVLNKDYTTVSDEEIKLLESILTVVNGKIVYSNGL
jgi:predicted amidohydrolase YtcJ